MPREKPQKVTVKVAALTDVGQVREHNEDSFLLADLTNGQRDASAIHRVGPAGLVLGVCDGMGGAAAGEVASRIAVDAIIGRMTTAQISSSVDVFAATLARAVEEAGEAIRSDVKLHPGRKGMGTTCTAVAVRGDTLFVAQVGDSRAYVFRHGALAQITKDQSLLNQLLELGQLNPKEAESFNGANVILQAVGSTEDLGVALTSLRLQQGDRVLVCSDGLHGLVPDDAIASVLASRSVEAACERLVELANRAGGKDNITVVIAEFDGPGLPRCNPNEPAACIPYALAEDAKRLVARTPLTPTASADEETVSLPVMFGRRHVAAVALALAVLCGVLFWGTQSRDSAAAPGESVAAGTPQPELRPRLQKQQPAPLAPAQPSAAQTPTAVAPRELATSVARPKPSPAAPTPRATPKPTPQVIVVPSEPAAPEEKKWAETGNPFESPFQ